MGSLQKNKTWESVKLPKGKRLFVASVYTARKKHYQKMKMQNSKHNQWLKITLKESERIAWTWLVFAACEPIKVKVKTMEEFANVT